MKRWLPEIIGGLLGITIGLGVGAMALKLTASNPPAGCLEQRMEIAHHLIMVDGDTVVMLLGNLTNDLQGIENDQQKFDEAMQTRMEALKDYQRITEKCA